MNESVHHGVDDEWGERISAYLDGEASDAERQAVERRLAEDPAAAELARSLTALREVCVASPAVEFPDLRGAVVAEIQRREAAGEGRVEVAPALEPEGEFGLPFGQSSRGWAWAGLAVAAAVMLSFYGGQPRPSGAGAVAERRQQPQLTQVAQQVRQALPQARQVRITTTPEGKRRLEQLLAQRGFRLGAPSAAAASSEFVALRRQGLPVEATPGDGGDQLLLVSAEQPAVRGLLSELEKEEGIFRVEADRPGKPSDGALEAGGGAGADRSETPAEHRAPAPSASARKLVFRIAVGRGAAAPQPAAGAKPVVLIIQAKPSR